MHQPADATFLLRFPAPGDGPGDGLGDGVVRVAVKDLVDVAGTVTTAGSPAVATGRAPAERDAPCLAGIRAAEARREACIVGKVNLHELAYGGDGINPHYGTPVNPVDPTRVPGGSSSGSAVAVATDQADVALGSDTGGSIRIPAACCGVVGLKTTWGRVPLDGVWPLAPFLDTLGPMGRTCTDVIVGMNLLEPGFRARTAATRAAVRIGRIVSPGGFAPEAGLQDAVDAALSASGIEVVDVEAAWWQPAVERGLTVLMGEAYRADRGLLRREHLLEPRIAARIRLGEAVTDAQLDEARAYRVELRRLMSAEMDAAGVQVLALPTLPIFAPLLDVNAANAAYTMYTRPANLAGTPALSMPVAVPAGSCAPEHAHLPGSLQLMGRAGDEELLMATGLRIEAAVRG